MSWSPFWEMIDDSVVICVTDCEWYILLILRALTTICKTSSVATSDAQASLRYPRIWPVHLCDLQPRLVTSSSCWSSQHFWVDLGNRCSFLKIRETTKIWFSFVNCALFAKPPTNSVGFGNQALFCANFFRFLNSSFLHFDRRPSISTHALFYATQGINRSTKSIRSFEWRNLTSCHLVLWLLIKSVLRLADGNLVQFWQIPTPTQKLHVMRASARLNRLI